MGKAIDGPRQTRQRHDHFDSTVWNAFAIRGDDIVIATADDEARAVEGAGAGADCARWLATGEGVGFER